MFPSHFTLPLTEVKRRHKAPFFMVQDGGKNYSAAVTVTSTSTTSRAM